jgi:XTP/dITP diphosphohydrolase
VTVQPPGGRGMARLVAVMDTLRSPGGCPWDAQQTHETLVPFALEEAHELAEAIEAGDRAGMREELGDVLLQVVFHARLAQEHETDAFGLDDVADTIAAKLVRRHPHVFARPSRAPADVDASTGAAPAADPDASTATAPAGPTPSSRAADDVHVRWEEIKKAEKARTSVLDGIALGQGSLSRGEKILSRARRGSVAVDVPDVVRRHLELAPPERAASAELGARLLSLLGEADASGVDAEAALRAALRTLETAVRSAEGG